MTDAEPREWGSPEPPAPATAAPVPTPEGAGPVPPRPMPPTERPAGPGRKRRRLWPYVLFGLVAVLALFAGCTVIGVSLARAPVGAANEFVALLDDGELEAAYASLCPAKQAEVDFEEFAADMARSTEISDYNLSALSAGIGDLVLVTGTVDLADDPPRNMTLDVVRDGDGWQVCDYDRLN